MKEPVTIIVSVGGASQNILETCVASIRRHTSDSDYKLLFACPSHQGNPASYVADAENIPIAFEDIADDDMSGSAVHGRLLDRIIQNTLDTDLFLTLDADCFPVDDSWLTILRNYIEEGAGVSGILCPYAPPPSDMKEGLEHRIRSHLCWNNTHVACQMTRKSIIDKLGVGFRSGDDTGLAIPMAAHASGWCVKGLMPTRCAKPEEDVEPELNRETCVIFGDSVYHHGKGCREELNRGLPEEPWDKIRSEVLSHRGAEFLLRSDMSHEYVFNREEEAAHIKVMDVMGGMVQYLQNHNSLMTTREMKEKS